MSRINTNVSSLLAQRILGQNNQQLTKSLERLSTGLSINRGADNPAGLIASELLAVFLELFPRDIRGKAVFDQHAAFFQWNPYDAGGATSRDPFTGIMISIAIPIRARIRRMMEHVEQ